jgi:hypothetical protein
MRTWALLPSLLLAACGEGGGEVARPARLPAPPIPVPARVTGPATPAPVAASADSIRGQTARALVAQFGQPRIDLQEGPARKLQFAGAACVLDIYLYSPNGRGEAVATHFDTRLRDGQPVNPASCVATLRRVSTP